MLPVRGAHARTRGSRALDAYLRHTRHTRPSAIAEAERRLREYSRNPPGRIRQGLGEFYAIPDAGNAESEIGDWLMVPADHLKRSIEVGDLGLPHRPDRPESADVTPEPRQPGLQVCTIVAA
ncbi:hypothetical protein ACWC0A_22380 [Streptomyces scopuliridis]